MTPGGKRYCFKENDKRYVFYDKEDFNNAIQRFFFLSRSASLPALAAYLDIPLHDMMGKIQRNSIPVDWMLRMSFKLYETIQTIDSDGLTTQRQLCGRFNDRYEEFVRQLTAEDKKKLTESMEKVILFDHPWVIDEATSTYLTNLNTRIHTTTRGD